MPYKARMDSGEPRKRQKPQYRVANARKYNRSLKRRGRLRATRHTRVYRASQQREGVTIVNLLNL